MSSSHLFLGLPIALLVLFLELRSGFHSAAFLSHLSHGEAAILSANFHFIFCVSCSSYEPLHVPSCPMRQLCFSYVFDPVFFFNLNCIHFFIRVFFKCHFTIHVIFRLCALTIVAFVISATNFGDVNISLFFFGLNILLFNFFCIFFLSG